MKSRLSDVRLAATTLPSLRGWGAAAAIFVFGSIPIALIAWFGNLIAFVPIPLGEALAIAPILLVVPAIGEELLFRAALIPRTQGTGIWPTVLSIALFVLWHPLQAVTIGPPWSDLFLDPAFLMAVGVMGCTLAWIYRVTRSLWPPVLAHWFIVFVWKALFGGPF